MKIKINTKKLIIFSIFVALLGFALIGRTVSKYVEQEKKESLYEAKSFYFESDYLSDGITPSYELAKGQSNISINLKNFEDDLRFADVAIDYVVALTDSNGNNVSDKSGKTITEKTGNLEKGKKSTKTVEFSNLPSGTYIVTARAVNPYTKTIKATYKITENDNEIKYTVSDTAGSNILQLTVTTNDYSGNVRINWPNGLAPDSTDPKFSTVNTGFSAGTCTVNFESNSEYTFQFFKQDPNHRYEKGNFTVGE